jgi:hypothetical protein
MFRAKAFLEAGRWSGADANLDAGEGRVRGERVGGGPFSRLKMLIRLERQSRAMWNDGCCVGADGHEATDAERGAFKQIAEEMEDRTGTLNDASVGLRITSAPGGLCTPVSIPDKAGGFGI